MLALFGNFMTMLADSVTLGITVPVCLVTCVQVLSAQGCVTSVSAVL